MHYGDRSQSPHHAVLTTNNFVTAALENISSRRRYKLKKQSTNNTEMPQAAHSAHCKSQPKDRTKIVRENANDSHDTENRRSWPVNSALLGNSSSLNSVVSGAAGVETWMEAIHSSRTIAPGRNRPNQDGHEDPPTLEAPGGLNHNGSLLATTLTRKEKSKVEAP